MKSQFRGLVVVVVAALLVWGAWWWAGHAYARPEASKRTTVVIVKPCVTPVGDIFSPGCPPGTGDGGGAAVQPEVVSVATPVPCITPPGAIFAPDCAAAPDAADNTTTVPATGAGDGGGSTPVPCITPPGAIFATDCGSSQ